MTGGLKCFSVSSSSLVAPSGFSVMLTGLSRATTLKKRCIRVLSALGLSLLLCFFLAVTSKVALADTPTITLNPAQQVYNSLVSGLLTTGQRNNAIMRDLCWRWFMHTDKRSKVPVIVLSGGKPLSWYVEQYPDSTNRQYQEWLADYQSNLFYKPYDLKSFNGRTTWTSGDAAAAQYYSEWYEWFEGESSGGGTVQDTNPYFKFDWDLTNNPYKATLYVVYAQQLNDDISVDGLHFETLNFDSAATVNYYNNQQGYKLYRTSYDTNKLLSTSFYVQRSNIGIFNYSVVRKTYEYYGFGPSDSDFQYWSSSGNNSTATYDEANDTNIFATGYYAHIRWGSALDQSSNQRLCVFTSCPSFRYNGTLYTFGNVGSGGSSEPVYPPIVDTNPQPQQPNVTNVSSPTYNNITYTTINQTDVDLQPIIDALAVHDQNMQDAWDSYSILFNDWMNVIKETLEGWRDVWLEYTSTLYEDLTMYLYEILQALENIYWGLNSEPVIEPTINEGNTLQNQTEVNLEALKRKFPTSIPWDLMAILRFFEAAPQAPNFTLPVVMTEYTVEIDFSDFDDMAAVSRRLSVLLFAVGLLMNTKKLVA